ncbi:trans-aconitate 2-methyltransferase [Streptomyces sp. ACA25]|uniref:trans-aconitate 2-methyltransferase n=1 Tax=Streptomyces sp. ACA25 TaxID=3022596 RepID=UPI0023080613|nr:trans-aconitate 2-methyltransferase [Streptomyces sp. ACA25]MDB1087254.1 trans-aconitate 2-methyltransferase [Streptomyces sp. ACA25]
MDAPDPPAPRATSWDPGQYLRHAGPRARPLHDLLARVPALPHAHPRIADLGCGPGGPTTVPAARWPTARITGYDNSPAMLEAARDHAGPTPGGGTLDFAHADLTDWRPDGPYDLILSNAALQWVPGHTASFPAWTESLHPGGVFAFQVPGNFTAPSHLLLREQVHSPRWRARLGDVLRNEEPVQAPADYLGLLTSLGCAADVWETTYLHLLAGPDPVLDWTKGTALRPVLTRLADDPEARDAFLAEYRGRLRAAYPPGPHGTVFPFRRIFAVAQKLPAPS